MPLIALDTETDLIKPGTLAPALACMSVYDGHTVEVLDASDAVVRTVQLLLDPTVTIVGHNIVYDLAVLNKAGVPFTLIFSALDAGRVKCTKIVELLELIRQGMLHTTPRPSLARLAAKYLDQKLDKANTPRLDYGRFIDVPLAEWPPEHITYAELDAITTYNVSKAQVEYNPEESSRQIRADWALHLMAVHGMRADAKAIAELQHSLEEQMAHAADELVEAGLLRPNKDRLSRNMAAIRERIEASHSNPPKTATGKTQTNADTIAECDDELLKHLVVRTSAEKTLGFLDTMRKAVDTPFNPSWNVLVETGRTSCGGRNNPGNLQNQPRAKGVRECWVPSEGCWFVFADYATAEVRTLAQNILWQRGKSEMAEILNSGLDIHQWFADQSGFLTRQGAKAAIFGIPGGLGAAALKSYAFKSYGVTLTLPEAEKLRDKYLNTFKGMRKYFDVASRVTGVRGNSTITHQWSGRQRGDVRYTQACNTPFQGDAADGAKLALYTFTRECYVGALKDLAKPVAFIHDEIITECPDNPEDALIVAKCLEAHMVEAMSQITPDIECVVEYACADRWRKGASAIERDGGLHPWTPEVSE